MSKTTNVNAQTEFKVTKKTSIIVSSNSHTICGIRTLTEGNEETIIVSSNPTCNFGERISTLFFMTALSSGEPYRSTFVDLLDYIDFGKDIAALYAVSSVSNYDLKGNVKDKVTAILDKYHLPKKMFGKNASKGA